MSTVTIVIDKEVELIPFEWYTFYSKGGTVEVMSQSIGMAKFELAEPIEKMLEKQGISRVIVIYRHNSILRFQFDGTKEVWEGRWPEVHEFKEESCYLL
jgi:hypothetical protein